MSRRALQRCWNLSESPRLTLGTPRLERSLALAVCSSLHVSHDPSRTSAGLCLHPLKGACGQRLFRVSTFRTRQPCPRLPGASPGQWTLRCTAPRGLQRQRVCVTKSSSCTLLTGGGDPAPGNNLVRVSCLARLLGTRKQAHWRLENWLDCSSAGEQGRQKWKSSNAPQWNGAAPSFLQRYSDYHPKLRRPVSFHLSECILRTLEQIFSLLFLAETCLNVPTRADGAPVPLTARSPGRVEDNLSVELKKRSGLGSPF